MDLGLAMRRRDLKRVMVIEQAVFPEPWSLTDLHLRARAAQGPGLQGGPVGRDVLGYVGLMFVDDEAHVTTIAVAPEHQHRGLGTWLLAQAVHLSLAQGARHLSLEVAVGNQRAQALYRRFGFAPVGVRKGYYPATGEDAYVMWAYDIDSAAYADRLAAIEAQLASRP